MIYKSPTEKKYLTFSFYFYQVIGTPECFQHRFSFHLHNIIFTYMKLLIIYSLLMIELLKIKQTKLNQFISHIFFLMILTWVEYFSSRHSVVAMFFEVLRQCCEIPSMVPPIGMHIIQSCGIWPPWREKGGTTWAAKSLLQFCRSYSYKGSLHIYISKHSTKIYSAMIATMSDNAWSML